MGRKGLVAGLAALALSAGTAVGAAAPERTCDVSLNVTDQDPGGLNVRAAPGGAVVGVLRARNAWVQVHGVAQSGEWIRIDRAVLIDDALPGGEKPLFAGRGYVHVGKLGIEELRSGAEIVDAPRAGATVLLHAPVAEDKVPRAVVVGCDGKFLQVRVGQVLGWTRDYCSNQYTTCA